MASEMLKDVLALVREVADHEILPRFLKVAHSHKDDGSVFTEADAATQSALIAGLTGIARKPVLGEEMTVEAQRSAWQGGADGLWCIDPIDGTSNFVAGVPYFVVSVAYLEAGKRRLGVVYDPVAREAFYAERGGGAWLNEERLPLRVPVQTLRRALAGVELKRIDRKLASYIAANPPYASQRNFGASALDWCYVAAGRLDVYLHGAQKLWDYAAGALILEEAGGSMAGLRGGFDESDIWERSVVASASPQLFQEWLAWLTRAAV